MTAKPLPAIEVGERKVEVIEERLKPPDGDWLPWKYTELRDQQDEDIEPGSVESSELGSGYHYEQRCVVYVPDELLSTERAAREEAGRELVLLRSVVDAANETIANLGKIQKRTPLHEALAAYTRFLAEKGK